MFKVGDRVQSTTGCDEYYPPGAIGTVVDVLFAGGCYEVAFDKDPGVKRCLPSWYASHDRLVPAPKVTCKVSAHKAAYRSNDPATSKGKRRVNKYELAVLDVLSVTRLGQTGKDIAAYSRHPLNCITPRFAPLRRKGLIKDSGTKRDKQVVWVLA